MVHEGKRDGLSFPLNADPQISSNMEPPKMAFNDVKSIKANNTELYTINSLQYIL